jgi:hypothetical protein
MTRYVAAASALMLVTTISAQPRVGVPCALDTTQLAEPLKVDQKQIKAEAKQTIVGSGGTTFNITYFDVQDNSNQGFDHPSSGAARRGAFERAVTYVGSILDHDGTFNIWVLKNLSSIEPSIPDNTVLAYAKPVYQIFPFFTASDAWENITQRKDLAPGQPELYVFFEFDYNYFPGPGNVPFTQFDLETVALHELMHGLGIASFSNANGTSRASGPNRTFTTFDGNLWSASPEVKLWDSDRVFQGPVGVLTEGDNQVYFRSDRAKEILGVYPPVFLVNPFDLSRSIGHWQDGNPIPLTTLMRPIYYNGEQIRELGPFELEILRDLNYLIVEPDPELWILR